MIDRYEARAAAHAARRDAERRLSVRISRGRLATVLPGGVCLVWALSSGMPPALVTAGVVLLAAFAVLVVWHARVEARAAWYEALHHVNLEAIARIRRAWDRLPPAALPGEASSAGARPGYGPDAAAAPLDLPAEPGEPARDSLEHHPYATDLDLFGRASLMQWLGPAATAAGTQTLHRWLLQGADPSEIRARQLAASELAGEGDWREALGAHGRLTAGIRDVELGRFLAWAEAPGPFSRGHLAALRAAVLGLTALIWILMAAQATGMAAAGYWLVPLTAGVVLSFVTAARVHGEFSRAGAGHHAFAGLADLMTHAAAAPGRVPRLEAIRARLTAEGAPAPACMRRLNRILGYAQLRAGAGILHFAIQAVTLWDFHVFFALDRWRARVGPRVREWMSALGEVDALSALARIKGDNPDWPLPEIAETASCLEAAAIGHPLIPDDRRVSNDVTVGPPGTLLLITGSNMSGKSTLLRAIGLNTVLAQAGGPVCAARLTLPPVDLETSIRIQDSLEHGLSYFMAALARLKGVVDRAQAASGGDGPRVMYLLDEILQGTNTVERAIAVRGIAAHLLAAGAIGVMTTHDLGLAAEPPLNSSAELAHFTEIVDETGRMSFDYRLRPGLATSRNALRLMQLIGIELPPA